jgi:hypothetical protein
LTTQAICETQEFKMADEKVTQLTEDTTPSLTDLVYTIKDPGGTPLDKNVQIVNLLALGGGGGADPLETQFFS